MNWIDKEVAFYDFIWAYGVGAHTNCINQELYEDFAAGGDKFEEMKKLILQKFPTREVALKEFETKSGTPAEDQHGCEPEKLHPNKEGREDCADCPYPERHCSECMSKAPDKVKPLAQYLAEYVEPLDHVGSYIIGWRELLQQALNTYESTEQVKIRIESV